MPAIREIRELAVPLSGTMSNAVVNFSDHDVSLVALVSDVKVDGKPLIGLGFNSIGRFAQSGIIQSRLIPRLLSAPTETLLSPDGRTFDPAAVTQTAMKNEKPGGHGDRAGAMAALELAVWDLNAKLVESPAWIHIAERTGQKSSEGNHGVSTYAAGGYYYDDDSVEKLKAELKDYRAQGFDAFKIKIGGAALKVDLERVDAAIEIAGSASRVAVDANGRFSLEDAKTYLAHLTERGLRWFEEPGDPLDFHLMSQLCEQSTLPMATGENLFSAQDTGNLLQYGGLHPGRDIFQMDAGLSYGLTEYLAMINLLETHGHSRSQCYPHGGHLINLHIAAALGLGGCEAYPGVFEPFGGFSSACRLVDGRVMPSDAPGFGLEEKTELQPYLNKLLEGL